MATKSGKGKRSDATAKVGLTPHVEHLPDGSTTTTYTGSSGAWLSPFKGRPGWAVNPRVKVKEKPAWISDEVWGEYLKAAAYLAYLKDMGGDLWKGSEAEVFEKIIFDNPCPAVWDVVYARRQDLSEDARDPMRSAPYYPLLWAAHNALKGPPADALMIAVDRKAKGMDIAKLAKQLRTQLARLGAVPPAGIAGPLGDHLHRVYESHASPQDIYGSALWSVDTFGILKASIVAHDLFFRDATNILATLEKAAKAWAIAEPYAKRRDSGRVKRDYFIRKMTDYFQGNFGSPQRRLVVELTRCLMDESVTERDVIRIAPAENTSASSSPKKTRPHPARSRGKS